MKILISLFVLSICFWSAGFAASDDQAALIAAVAKTKHSLLNGIGTVVKSPEAAISAKFEFDDDHHLSLSVYSARRPNGWRGWCRLCRHR